MAVISLEIIMATSTAVHSNAFNFMSYPPEPFLHLAAGIKEVVKAPVLHAQNIKDPNQATRILEGGYVDMVGMTRAHMADPHLIAKIKMGQIDQIKQCVGANYCIDRQYQGLDVLCIQNAATSREYMGVPHIIEKSTGPKRKVAVESFPGAGIEQEDHGGAVPVPRWPGRPSRGLSPR